MNCIPSGSEQVKDLTGEMKELQRMNNELMRQLLKTQNKDKEVWKGAFFKKCQLIDLANEKSIIKNFQIKLRIGFQ